MELIASRTEAAVAQRILGHLGLASTGLLMPKPRRSGEAPDQGPEHHGAGPTDDD